MRQPLILTTTLLSFLLLTAATANAQTFLQYEINFKQTCEGWSAADNNSDGYTWNTDFLDFSGVYMEGMYAPHNDDYISPKFSLKKGKTYNISTNLEQMMLPAEDTVTLLGGTDKSSLNEIAKLSTSNFGPNEDIAAFTAEVDGEYYFAFRYTSPAMSFGSTLSLCKFSVTEVESEIAASLPYGINFKQTCEGWSAADNNNDGYTWNSDYLDFRGVYMEGMYAPHNDDYISPKFSLKKGKTYNISTNLEQMMLTAGETVTLMGGTDKAALNEITRLSTDNFGPNEEKTTFTPETDGDYYFAFRYTSDNVSYGSTLSLCGFILEEAVEDILVEIPYEIDFKENTDNWTTADNNNDGYTWNTDFPDFGVYMEGNAIPHNDDFISPGFFLSSEHSYVIATVLEVVLPSGSDVVTLVGGNDKNELHEIGSLSVTKQGPNADEFVFTPETDGKFYFAFRNSTSNAPYLPTQYVSACKFSIKEQELPNEGELISTDFSGQNPLKDWTVIDGNSDNNTWKIEDGLDGVVYNGESAAAEAQDWLISPKMSLKGGQDYLLKYTLAQSGAFSNDIVEIRFGNEPSEEGMPMVLVTETLDFDNGNGTLTHSARISCTDDGSYLIGFHIITSEPNGIVSLTNVEVVETEKAIPQPVAALTAKSDRESETVTLTWNNPTKDTSDANILSVDILIYENEKLVATLPDRTAGAEDLYTYKPEVFSGDVIYTVKASINGLESDIATTTICLDDINGELILVKEMPITAETSPEWIIINNGGHGEWVYDSFQCFYFKHPNGKPTDEDDWAITPAFDLQTGIRYIVKYQLATNAGGGATFDVTQGDAQTPEAQTNILDSRTDLKQNGIGEFETRQFAVSSNGRYYIGFHATNVAHSITLSKVALYYIKQIQTGIENITAEASIKYDNEASILKINGDFSSLTVYDARGRVITALNPGSNSTVNMSGIEKGLYIVRLTDRNGATETFKFVK